MKNLFSLFLVLTSLMASALYAQDAAYQIGDVVAPFELKNVDGEMLSTDDFRDAEGFIVVFTCNTCPWANLYEERIMDLDVRYREEGYPVLAINPNDPVVAPGDAFDKMVSRAEEKGYTFPYLVDETQEIARAFGATRTPHTYILQKTGEGMILKYIGAIDDSPRDPEAVQVNYIDDAIAALQTGDPIPTESTKAIGCTIKWARLTDD